MPHLTIVRRNSVGGVFVIAFVIVAVSMAPAALPEGDVNNALRPALDWELKNLDGKKVRLCDFRGKVVILDFWATWCMPCRLEIPYFVELQKQYGDKGLAVVGVSLDEQGPQVVRKFIKEFGVNFPIAIGNEKIAEAYGGIEGIPTTFVIDRHGRIVRAYVGYNDKSVFEKEIQSLF